MNIRVEPKRNSKTREKEGRLTERWFWVWGEGREGGSGCKGRK